MLAFPSCHHYQDDSEAFTKKGRWGKAIRMGIQMMWTSKYVYLNNTICSLWKLSISIFDYILNMLPYIELSMWIHDIWREELFVFCRYHYIIKYCNKVDGGVYIKVYLCDKTLPNYVRNIARVALVYSLF